MAGNRDVVQRKTFGKGFTRDSSVFLDDVLAEPRCDLVDLLNWFGRNASIADPTGKGARLATINTDEHQRGSSARY
jgi:hypothetical protein